MLRIQAADQSQVLERELSGTRRAVEILQQEKAQWLVEQVTLFLS